AAPVLQHVCRSAASNLAMDARDSVTVEDDLAVFIASNSRSWLSQEKSRASGAQPADETHTKSAHGNIGCGSPPADPDGDSGIMRASIIVFLTNHCRSAPS